MSDRTVIALATVPMISGALLLVALQRVPPVRVNASANKASLTHATEGAVEAAPWLGVVVAGHTAELATENEGRVDQVLVSAGARVKKGQPILQVDLGDASHAEALADAELGQRRSEVARAEATYEDARAKRERLEQGGSWISARELEAARAEERAAKADVRSARAGVSAGRARQAQSKLRARRYTLEAPFDGVLVSCDVDPGDSVNAGQVLARVITDDRQVRFAFPRDQLPPNEDMEVLLTLPTGVAKAKVESIQPEVDPAAQLIFAIAKPPIGGPPLLPGTRVEVRYSPDPEKTPIEGR
ncbi:MAG: efflux RND transporter periplasmic adaptor subunit [Polyangiales bacterium]